MADDIIGYVPISEDVPAYHLRDGFWFWRDGDEIVVSDRLGAVHEIRVPVNEWASVLAHTSVEGETGDKFREALTFLGGADV